jgi:benzoate transport
MERSITQEINEKSMNGFQWSVVMLCFIVSMVDGFDVLVMAFTASAVAEDWSLSGVELGYLLSAAPIGMALGSLFLAPWADRQGRRPLIIGCLALVGTTMTGSAYAASPIELGWLRFSSGVGIGAIMASSYVIAGEFASKRWRGLAIGLQSAAFSTGAAIGGLIAIRLIPDAGWRAVFLCGGLMTLATLLAALIWLPESIDFLASRKSAISLRRINRILPKLGLLRLDRLPDRGREEMPPPAAHLSDLFKREARAVTLSIWGAFFLAFLGFYFVFSWTPRLLATSGLTGAQASTSGVLLNMGGILGAASVGLLAARFPLDKVLTICMLINAALMAMFSHLLANLTVGFILIFLIGFFSNGCIAGLFALTPSLYQSSQRVTGLGWAIGIGRIGAILAPTLTGTLIGASWRASHLFLLFGVFFVFSATLIALMNTREGIASSRQNR